jgi:uncharacterized surface protein with fasciclin (FAS1) repeats
MRLTRIFMAAATATLALAACDKQAATDNRGMTENAAEAAGDKTIADGLSGDGKFAAAAKSAGLDRTLDGPGPYTVLVPSDAAFDKLPAGSLDNLMKPESRVELTKLLTYHVLPGTILAEDIAKAIDTGGGKAILPTMEGATLTATKEGDKIVISDGTGAKAVVTQADDKRSNGVIHRVDAVLMPS